MYHENKSIGLCSTVIGNLYYIGKTVVIEVVYIEIYSVNLLVGMKHEPNFLQKQDVEKKITKTKKQTNKKKKL